MLHDVLIFLAHVVFLYFYEMYMLGGDIMFMFLFLLIISHCATLIIDLYYEVIHDICLYFLFYEIKNLFCFYLYFPHMRLCVCRVFQEFTS